jgi:hypothetical protein
MLPSNAKPRSTCTDSSGDVTAAAEFSMNCQHPQTLRQLLPCSDAMK